MTVSWGFAVENAWCPLEKKYCVYIMSNISKMLYVGVTNDLEKRVF